jgi:hypothetical protein
MIEIGGNFWGRGGFLMEISRKEISRKEIF